jgi:hypothetical protein
MGGMRKKEEERGRVTTNGHESARMRWGSVLSPKEFSFVLVIPSEVEGPHNRVVGHPTFNRVILAL